jgi:hypothetical protein
MYLTKSNYQYLVNKLDGVTCGTGTAKPFRSPEFTYGFWFRLIYHCLFRFPFSFVLSLRRQFTNYDYFWFLYWISFSFMCSVLLHPFSSGYCVVYPSTTHAFLLPLWCVQTFPIVLKLWWFSNNRLVTLLDCSVMLQ